jgi:hypothetical protein
MAYESVFTKPYQTWHNLPTQDTPVTASVLEGYDEAIEHIEDHLEGSTAIKPVSKTSAMTQQVGVDNTGKLFTTPGSGGGGGTAATTTYDNTESGLEATNVQTAIDEVNGKIGNKVNATSKTIAMTQSVGIDSNGALWTEPGGGGGGGSTFENLTVGVRNSESIVGTYSVAEGSGITSSGSCSHAEGNGCTASGDASHAEGIDTTANTYAAHAEGDGSIASGTCSHAEGQYTTASGIRSHASGNHTIASYDSQFVCGKYNSNQSDNLFEVGNGSDGSTRANAFSVGQSGDAHVSSSLTVGEGTHTSYSNRFACGTYNEDDSENIFEIGDGDSGNSHNIFSVNYLGAARAENSMSVGEGTYASDNQLVCGLYNNNDSNNLFEIGNGFENERRANAFSVDGDGNVTIGGEIDCSIEILSDKDYYVYVSDGSNILKLSIADLKILLQ